VEESPGSIKRTLLELNINRSTFYKWYRRYQEGGFDAMANRYRHPDNSGMRYHHGKANGWLKHLLSTRRSHLGSWYGASQIPVNIIYLNQPCTEY
jgi:transposase